MKFRQGWPNKYLIACFCLLLTNCQGNLYRLDDFEPKQVALKESVKFKVYGKNLSSQMKVSLGDYNCTNPKADATGSQMTANCTSPNSGTSTFLEVKMNGNIISNGKQTVKITTRYTKLDVNGAELDADEEARCVRDNVKKLYWLNMDLENNSLYNAKNKFVYSTDGEENKPDDCPQMIYNANNALTEMCDTYSYLKTLNEVKPCSIGNWVIPTREDLNKNFQCRYSPNYNAEYFRNIQLEYWTKDKVQDNEYYIYQTEKCEDLKSTADKTHYLLPVSKY